MAISCKSGRNESGRRLAVGNLVMSSPAIHQCQCPQCRSGKPHKDRDSHHHINLFLSRMREQHRRWLVALAALRNGHGGKQLLSQITGMSATTMNCMPIWRIVPKSGCA
jgi:threonine dehydrogenase-like Zn-dependent dehydrogenase